MYQQQQPRWWKRVLWLGGILVTLLVALFLIRIGYADPWTGFTGFGQQKVDTEHVQPAKTLWDWLGLLIIPIVLAIGGFLFTRSENRATQAAAERRALDDTLQAYLDGMSQLVTDKEQPLHSAQPGDSLSTLARARTLTVLSRLDGGRKRSVLQFLYESGLIAQEQALLDESDLIEKRHNIISLQQADLRGANLLGANLIGADLRWADLRWSNLSTAYLSGANLRGANLSEADLIKTDLRGANLSGTYRREAVRKVFSGEAGEAFLHESDLMRGASLSKADLRGAYLRGANLREAALVGANLRGANLSEADLREAALIQADLIGANLRRANLRRANLSEADLRSAKEVTIKQLSAARYLEGATMPDGRTLRAAHPPWYRRGTYVPDPNEPTFEDWLKSKGSGEDGENTRSS